MTDQNFELKIYSGKDRIWSSQDCGKTIAAFDKKLARSSRRQLEDDLERRALA